MKINACMIILIGILSQPASAEVFKCVTKSGGVVFQALPCDTSSVKSEKLDMQHVSKANPPAKINDKNKALFKLFSSYENLKVVVNHCNTRHSAYGREISQAYQRLFDIRRAEIEKGRVIFNQGFEGLPNSELITIQSKAQNEKRLELNEMNMNELDRLCDSQARTIRQLASQGQSRSSGYTEGDIDPEGND